jgi:hypothetical protein
MTLDEYRETVMLPSMLRMMGLPDTPQGRVALQELAMEEMVAVVKSKIEGSAA